MIPVSLKMWSASDLLSVVPKASVGSCRLFAMDQVNGCFCPYILQDNVVVVVW